MLASGLHLLKQAPVSIDARALGRQRRHLGPSSAAADPLQYLWDQALHDKCVTGLKLGIASGVCRLPAYLH